LNQEEEGETKGEESRRKGVSKERRLWDGKCRV
jgi:hypothetical protein